MADNNLINIAMNASAISQSLAEERPPVWMSSLVVWATEHDRILIVCDQAILALRSFAIVDRTTELIAKLNLP